MRRQASEGERRGAGSEDTVQADSGNSMKKVEP